MAKATKKAAPKKSAPKVKKVTTTHKPLSEEKLTDVQEQQGVESATPDKEVEVTDVTQPIKEEPSIADILKKQAT